MIGIIAEYNPPHNGHAYHMAASREHVGDARAPVLCVMSGSVTQRGEPAVLSKWARAEAAVRSGANLIIELPAPYACAPAEVFARAAVHLLALTGQTEYLAFGSECGRLEPLERVCEIMEHPGFDAERRAALETGVSYPSAMAAAVKRLALVEQMTADASVLDGPNNMLALCYLKALRALGAPMTPVTVARRGAAHDAQGVSQGFASASELRGRIARREPLDGLVPDAARDVIRRELEAGRAPVSLHDYGRLTIAALRRLDENDWIAQAGDSEGLGSRLYKAARGAKSLNELLETAKTKRYTLARLRRVALRAYLGVPPGMQDAPPPYLRVLAFDAEGAKLLRAMRATARVPVIIKPAAYKTLDASARTFFELECAVTDILAFHRPSLQNCAAGAELRTGPVVVE